MLYLVCLRFPLSLCSSQVQFDWIHSRIIKIASWIFKSINQSINQSNDRKRNESINQSIIECQSIDWLTNELSGWLLTGGGVLIVLFSCVLIGFAVEAKQDHDFNLVSIALIAGLYSTCNLKRVLSRTYTWHTHNSQ